MLRATVPLFAILNRQIFSRRLSLYRNGLLEEVRRPVPHRVDRHRDVAVPREEDKGKGEAAGFKDLLEVQPREPRHPDVSHNAARPRERVPFKELFRGRVRGDLEPPGFEEHLLRREEKLVVVDQADERVIVRVYLRD